MARIAGINIPDNKHAEVSLTHIFGIGRSRALDICSRVGISPSSKISDLSEKEQELKQDLSKLDINDLTPLEALSKLDELKKKHGL